MRVAFLVVDSTLWMIVGLERKARGAKVSGHFQSLKGPRDRSDDDISYKCVCL